MAKQYIEIGGDKTIVVNVDDSAGANEDLSAYEGYIVRLYYKQDGTVIQTYSKNAVSGFNSTDISTTDEANGNITIYLKRELTEAGLGDWDVYAQVLVQETDSNYASSQYRDLAPSKYAFTFRNSSIETTTDIS